MEVQLLETNRHSFVKPERQGSLYDETPLLGKFIQQIYIYISKYRSSR